MNTIRFLGTAGARFVVMEQLRASGGLWITLDKTSLLIDPGPGSLVRCLAHSPRLNPLDLDAIILTHRHLDHSNDINIMMEAMTNGGFKKRGVVFAPSDALDHDPVILQYVREKVERIERLTEKGTYSIGNISFSTPIRLKHGAETYGVNIKGKTHTISLISDTDYFEGLASPFNGDILILNVMMLEDRSTIEHLCLRDAEQIIADTMPRLTILTHFGMAIVNADPQKIAQQLSTKLGVAVLAAQDDQEINIDEYNT